MICAAARYYALCVCLVLMAVCVSVPVNARPVDLIVIVQRSALHDARRVVALIERTVGRKYQSQTRIALITYASRAHLLTPLAHTSEPTLMHPVVEGLDQLREGPGASGLGLGVSRALDLLPAAAGTIPLMIVFADGSPATRSAIAANHALKPDIDARLPQPGGGIIVHIESLRDGPATSSQMTLTPTGLREITIKSQTDAERFAQRIDRFLLVLTNLPSGQYQPAEAPSAREALEPMEPLESPGPEAQPVRPPAQETPGEAPASDDVEKTTPSDAAPRPSTGLIINFEGTRQVTGEEATAREAEAAAEAEAATATPTATPAPIPTSASRPTLPAATPDQKANLAFNAPESMPLNAIRGIHLLLSGNQSVPSLTAQIDQPGEKHSGSLKVAPLMRAQVQGTAFKITPLTSAIQPFAPGEVSEWRWEVQATQAGEQRLYVVVESVQDNANGNIYKTVDSHSQVIRVVVDDPWTTHSRWLWLAATTCALLVAVAFIMVQRRKRTRRLPRVPSADKAGADVFVSYSRHDMQAVNGIIGALEDDGITVWIDQTGIETATQWSEQIVEGIEACRVLLLIASRHAFESENVAREVQLAMEKNKAIVPAKLDETPIPARFQYPLAGVQHLSLGSNPDADTVELLTRTLTRMLTKNEQA